MGYIGRGPVKSGAFRIIDSIASSFNGSTTGFTLQHNSSNITPGTEQNLLILKPWKSSAQTLNPARVRGIRRLRYQIQLGTPVQELRSLVTSLMMLSNRQAVEPERSRSAQERKRICISNQPPIMKI